MKITFRRFGKSLWFRPALYAVGAAVVVLACWAVDYLQFPVEVTVQKNLVSILLGVITTSMLTVSIFAVGSMVTAYASATAAGTPRAFQLIIADGTSQNASSSFIGAFIFAVMATVGVQANLFDERGLGLLLLFLFTIGILVWVIGTFIVWFDNIARLGQIDTSIQKAEDAAASALQTVTNAPYLGGVKLSRGERSSDVVEIRPTKFGYLNRIEMADLEEVATELDVSVLVLARPGALVDPSIPIVLFDDVTRERLEDRLVADTDAQKSESREELDALIERVQAAFVVQDARSFELDPEFSLTVLSEIAAKALSPGVNDPGTARTVINAVTRQIADWHGRSYDRDEPDFPHVHVPPIESHRLVRAGFDMIARYGAEDADVVNHLLAALRYLSTIADHPAEQKIDYYAAGILDAARVDLSAREYDEIVNQCPANWANPSS